MHYLAWYVAPRELLVSTGYNINVSRAVVHWTCYPQPPLCTSRRRTSAWMGSAGGGRTSPSVSLFCGGDGNWGLMYDDSKGTGNHWGWHNTPTDLSTSCSSWPSFIHCTVMSGSETSHSNMARFFSRTLMSLMCFLNSI